MGGDPTLHPEYECMTHYLCKPHGMTYDLRASRRPVNHFRATERPKISYTFYFFNHNTSSLPQAGNDGIVQCKDLDQFQNLWPEDKQIRVTTLPEYMPATDEHEWMDVVDWHVLQDRNFCCQFASIMLQSVPGKGNILITQSASYF